MKHVVAVLLLALAATFPLVSLLGHWSNHLPGDVIGDNVAFLWNFWWMRQAGIHFFVSPYLFAPYGVNLVLHTHTALEAAFGATVLGHLSLVTAQNIVIGSCLAMNSACAYLLAWERTRSFPGAVAAALVFGASPYISAHLLGHFNLVAAWPLPIFVLCVLRSVETRSAALSIAAGLTSVILAYSDYYYLVYCLIWATGVLLWRSELVDGRMKPAPLRGSLSIVVGYSIGAILLASVAIVLTGGFDGMVAGIRIRATTPGNLLTVAWVLLGVAVWRRLGLTLHVSLARAWLKLREDLRILLPGLLIFLIAAGPLAWCAFELWKSGRYSAPVHHWRSDPDGVDLLSLFIGNPFNPLTGRWTRGVYTRLGFDPIETVGWLGVIPGCVLVWATAQSYRQRALRPLVICAWSFLLWSFGPWLKLAGINTGLLLPSSLFGLLPILSNARIPGRAIVMVYLAIGLLTARLISSPWNSRRRWVVALVLVLIAADFLPAPVPTVQLEVPRIYAAIPAGKGAVLELPLGLRDGFGEIGSFDERTLLHQMQHGRPLLGGFVARLPQPLKRDYAELPVVRSLLTLSGHSGTPSHEDLRLSSDEKRQALREASVEYVVLDHATASKALTEFVSSIHLHRLDSDGRRDLLAVAIP